MLKCSGTLPTCNSGGDVRNIQVPFSIAVTEMTSAVIKAVCKQVRSINDTFKKIEEIKLVINVWETEKKKSNRCKLAKNISTLVLNLRC